MFSKRFLVNVLSKRYIYRPRAEIQRNNTASSDILKEAIKNQEIKSLDDWKKFRNEILETSGPRSLISPVTIDAMMIGVCTSLQKYDLAFSYLDFLKKEGIKPNLATIGKYFKLMHIKGAESLSQDDEKQILSLFDSLRKSYPVLDSLTLDSVIQALSLTKNWRKCLDLLEEIRISATPSNSSFSAIIAAAFTNNEDDLAWKLLNEMLEMAKIPHARVYLAYFKRLEAYNDKKTTAKEMQTMFSFLQKSQLIVDKSVAEKIFSLCRKFNIVGRLSTIYNEGVCGCCKSKLETFDLSEEDFARLKQRVIDKVIVGKDVFNKSSPEELIRFKNFVSNMGQFDVVVDGLNVAYSVGVKQPPQISSALVASVVSYFTEQDKKVLVLGRKHMNRWPRENWGYVTENATVFLTQDLSQDDPYLLYCALHSGRDTIIVTRDLMRGHKFLLRNLHLQLMFQRWLSQRQYQLVRTKKDGTPIFKLPLSYSRIAQEQNGFWHVPYEDEFQNRNKPSNSWLCIKI